MEKFIWVLIFVLLWLGCELKGEAGAIHFVPDRNGRGTCNGEAFIEMADDSSMDRALAKNKQTIGQR